MRSTSTSTYFTRHQLSIRQNCILTWNITKSDSIHFESSSYISKQALRFWLDDQWWCCKDIDWFCLCITSSLLNVLLSCHLRLYELNWNVFERVIQHFLELHDFRRHETRRKSYILKHNHLARLAWAYEHLFWTWEQWNWILWMNETWITNRHTKILLRACILS